MAQGWPMEIAVMVPPFKRGLGVRALAAAAIALGAAGFGAAVLSPPPAAAQAPVSINEANANGDKAFQANDYATALRWYVIAADQGDASAQYNAGWIYDNGGNGVTQDYVTARRYYLLAADQGNAGAQNNLGEFYYYGHGVAIDLSVAAHWYTLAAAQGEQNAEFNLGWMYAHGEGGRPGQGRRQEVAAVCRLDGQGRCRL
jgi:TPR repeat protein